MSENKKLITKKELFQTVGELLNSPEKQINQNCDKEFAKLLSLLDKVNNDDFESLNLIETAINACFISKNEEPGKINEAKPFFLRRTVNPRLELVKEIIKRIDYKTNIGHPLTRMITGRGSNLYRLISGVTWFFLIFVIGLPFLLMILKMGVEILAIPIFKKAAIRYDQEAEYFYRWQDVETKRANELNELMTTAKDNLTFTSNALSNENTESKKFVQGLAPIINNYSKNLSTKIDKINSDYNERVRSQVCGTRWTVKSLPFTDSCENISPKNEFSASNIESDLNTTLPPNSLSFLANFFLLSLNIHDDMVKSAPTRQSSGSAVKSDTLKELEEGEIQKLKPIERDIWLYMLLMGALGGCISVIFRMDEIIKLANKEQSSNDLFYTGFYKPIIGMGIALLAVALIRSNIFGIIRIQLVKENDPWAYIAIAFIAGFSERLSKDITSKADNLLSNSDNNLDEYKSNELDS